MGMFIEEEKRNNINMKVDNLELYCAHCRQRIAPHHIHLEETPYVTLYRLKCNNSKCGKTTYVEIDECGGV